MNDIFKTLLTVIITGGVTLGGAFFTFKGKKSESDANMAKAYIDGNTALFNNMQAEINRLIGQVAILQKEVETVKKDNEAETTKLKKENDDLRNKLRDAIAKIKFLEEKLNEN
ncbi:hypothetical protein [Streptococcus uberis]|uniref:hypothetical protein n=1 Tax=Streptococcus uberis TaxID=1349 RepID=UPI0030C88B54